MFRPVRWILLALSAVSGLARAAFDARPLITAYTAQDFGQDAISWTTVEDSEHGLHFGASSLLSFDGSRWRSDPAGNSYALRGLDVDPDGRIWAAGNGELGWFSRPGNGSWQFHSLRDRLPAAERDLGEMWKAYAIPGGAVFAGSNTLYWWLGGTLSAERFDAPRRISALRSSGRIYVCQAAIGLWRVRPGEHRRVLAADQLAGGTVVWMEDQAAPGRLLLATTRGFLAAAGGKTQPLFPEASELLRQWGLTEALRLPDGRLAVATLRGGILILDPAGRVSERFSRSNGLPTDEVFSLHADAEGGLWGTSSAHLFRVSLAGARWYEEREGLGAQPCIAIARGAGALTFATNTGLFRADDGGEHLLPVAGIDRHCCALAVAGDQLLLGRNGGMDRIAAAGNETLYQGPSDVAAIAVEADGSAAVIAAGQTLMRAWLDARGPAAVVATVPETPSTLALGSAGEVWAGTTTQGVFHGTLRPGSAPRLAPAPFAPAAGTGVVAGSGDGFVYAFVGQAGWRIRGGEAALRIRDLPGRIVTAAEAGPAGIWIAHPADPRGGACLAEIRDGPDGPRWIPRLAEGIWRVGVPESIHAEVRNGRVRLWIGGTAGILRCDLAASGAGLPLPAPALSLRRANGSEIAAGASLPYSAGELVLSARVNRYALRPALTVETKVDPADRDWSPLDESESRHLTALRDGNYQVRARIRASTGELSAESRQSVSILPPWWRTWVAAGGFAVLIGGAGYGLRGLNSRALRRRAERLERAVRGRTREVEQANAEKTRFVAGISHDIRNPLNGIVGLTLALEDSELTVRQRELTAAMRGCAKYLDGLVDEVIDFAQVESGHGAVRSAWYAVAELVDDVLGITRPEAELETARVTAEIAVNVPPRLWGDAGRVRQILVNLTLNAIRHAGGAIVLGVRRADGESAAAIEFAVTDAGPGIAAHDQSRLFEPFSRIEGQHRRRSSGSGLGLASSKRWAEAMGGKMGVVSAAGRGCRFTLVIPLGAAPSPEPAAVPRVVLRRVLVVEDEDYNAWAIAAVAARVGVTVTARAATGAEALRLFAPGRFDGVLLDRLLPDMDGTKVARSIRRAGDAAVKIIALTAGATAEDRAACLAAGMDAFIGKPLTPEKLIAALNQLAAAADSPAAPVTFDLRLIDYLADDAPGGQARQVERYLLNLDEAAAAMRAALVAEDARAIEECAHRLHGHLRMIEAEEARAAAAKIEDCAKRLELPPAPAAEHLAAAIVRLRAALTPLGDPRQNPARGRNAAAPGPI